MNISDVEKRTGLSPTAIRFYEERGLIAVKRRENGYRDYDEDSILLLNKIRTLRSLGVPLADIRLWRDGVISLNELITKRLRAIEDDSKHHHECRSACEALLVGEWEQGPSHPLQEDTAPLPTGPLLLGVDVGTTTISAVVSAADGNCIEACLIDHGAAITLSDYPDAFAADADLLITRTLSLIGSLLSAYPTIASIGITGQMHGIVCLDKAGNILSPLYTWQNQFGNRAADHGKTLCQEIASLCGENIPTGYGITTYYALRRLKLLPPETAAVVTIADLAVSRLCQTHPLLHPTNAAAMGGYDLATNEFKTSVLEALAIPRDLFPAVADGYALAGSHRHQSRTVPVAVAIGDNQASMLGSLSSDKQILLNIGTSSQISMIASGDIHAGGELRPYFNGKYILSGAALCGGSAYALLKNLIQSILKGFGVEVGDKAIYEYLNRAAARTPESPLSVKTQFNGTRNDPHQRGEITNVTLSSLTPENLSTAFLYGICEELYQMYRNMTADDSAVGIVASGNAMRKNPALQKIASRVFGKSLTLPLHTEEAAFGAALFGGIAAGLLTPEESYTRIHYQTN